MKKILNLFIFILAFIALLYLFLPKKITDKGRKLLSFKSRKIQVFQEHVYFEYDHYRIFPAVFIIDLYKDKDYLGKGYGFFLEKDGKFVTNLHLFKGANKAEIRLHDNLNLDVKSVMGMNPDEDIIILKVEMNGFIPKILDISINIPKAGEFVGYIGSFAEGRLKAHTGVITFISSEEYGEVLFSNLLKDRKYAGVPVINKDRKIMGMLVNYNKNGKIKSFIVPIKEILNLDLVRNVKISDFKVPLSLCKAVREVPMFEQGLALINQKKYDEAIPYFRKSLKEEPDNMNYLITLGKTLALAKEKEAIGILSKVLKNQPENEEVLFYLGYVYEVYRDYIKALNAYEKVIERNQFNFKAYLGLIRIYTEILEYKKAVTTFCKLEDNGYMVSNPDEYYLIAYDYFRLGNYRKTADLCYNIISISSVHYKALFLLGMINLEGGFWNKSLEYFERAASIKKNQPELYHIIGLLYLLNHNKENATLAISKLRLIEKETYGPKSDRANSSISTLLQLFNEKDSLIIKQIKYFKNLDEVKRTIYYKKSFRRGEYEDL
jgi:tetratricopeptide (TPR) repeat protein